jgi:hypothetical protein
MSLAQSTSDFAVETIRDVLENIPNQVGGYGYNYGINYGEPERSAWHNNSAPEIYKWEEVTQKGKENNPDPAVYIWSPVDTDLTEFSADGNRLTQEDTVECQVWSYDNQTTRKYAKDVADILGEYMRDNFLNTNFHQIVPETIQDARSEKVARQTDHYISVVTVSLSDFRKADLRN